MATAKMRSLWGVRSYQKGEAMSGALFFNNQQKAAKRVQQQVPPTLHPAPMPSISQSRPELRS